MGLSVLSGTKWDSESVPDGTLGKCGECDGTGGLCLLIRVSQVRDLHGLPKLENIPYREVLRRIRVSRH
jgi:hypothetical protein